MAKKINIIGIATKDGGGYTVGNVAFHELIVERIVYEKHAYNKGHQGDFPAYVIFHEGSNVRSIIPQERVIRVNVEMIEEDSQVEIAPELPE